MYLMIGNRNAAQKVLKQKDDMHLQIMRHVREIKSVLVNVTLIKENEQNRGQKA